MSDAKVKMLTQSDVELRIVEIKEATETGIVSKNRIKALEFDVVLWACDNSNCWRDKDLAISGSAMDSKRGQLFNSMIEPLVEATGKDKSKYRTLAKLCHPSLSGLVNEFDAEGKSYHQADHFSLITNDAWSGIWKYASSRSGGENTERQSVVTDLAQSLKGFTNGGAARTEEQSAEALETFKTSLESQGYDDICEYIDVEGKENKMREIGKAMLAAADPSSVTPKTQSMKQVFEGFGYEKDDLKPASIVNKVKSFRSDSQQLAITQTENAELKVSAISASEMARLRKENLALKMQLELTTVTLTTDSIKAMDLSLDPVMFDVERERLETQKSNAETQVKDISFMIEYLDAAKQEKNAVQVEAKEREVFLNDMRNNPSMQKILAAVNSNPDVMDNLLEMVEGGTE